MTRPIRQSILDYFLLFQKNYSQVLLCKTVAGEFGHIAMQLTLYCSYQMQKGVLNNEILRPHWIRLRRAKRPVLLPSGTRRTSLNIDVQTCQRGEGRIKGFATRRRVFSVLGSALKKISMKTRDNREGYIIFTPDPRAHFPDNFYPGFGLSSYGPADVNEYTAKTAEGEEYLFHMQSISWWAWMPTSNTENQQ